MSLSFPIELQVGSNRLSAHMVLEVLAFTVGFRYFLYLRKQFSDTIKERNRIWIIIGAGLGAFLFSRLLGSLEDPTAWRTTHHPLLYFFTSKTIVGGLLGGLLAVEITKYFLGEQRSSGDLFTYPLILAMIIGRIGCFSSGVYEPTFGKASALPWALDLGDGIPRHPVALYEIAFLSLLWIWLRWQEKRHTLREGIRFQYFMIAYLLFRFLLDFIKPAHIVLAGLSTIQLAAMIGLLYYYRTISQFVTSPVKLRNHE